MNHPRDMDPNRDEFEYPDHGVPRPGADEHPDNPHPDADGDVTADAFGSRADGHTGDDDADDADEPDALEQPDS